ncbi:hypothetical protein HY639_00730 [Candidatus Woesearchaeota archaeon]|nr:hypothetical protein [Candidatus Woesearchaeota archaeon]
MIITIDTTRDSEEEIGKVIAFLSSLINKVPVQENPPPTEMNVSPQATDVFSQLFDTPEQKSPPVQPETAATKEDEYLELPKVVAYKW